MLSCLVCWFSCLRLVSIRRITPVNHLRHLKWNTKGKKSIYARKQYHEYTLYCYSIVKHVILPLRITSKKNVRDLNGDFDKFFLISSSNPSFYVKEIYEYISFGSLSLSLSLSLFSLIYFKMTNASGSIVLTSSFFFNRNFFFWY